MQMYDINFNMQGDDLVPRFYTKSVEGKRDKDGHPTFNDIEYVRIFLPGSKTTVVDHAVSDTDKQKFPEHYKAFQKGKLAPAAGIPVDAVPYYSPSQVDTLKAHGLFTVEMVAAVEKDPTMQPKLVECIDYAKEYIATKKDDGGLNKLIVENKKLKGALELLTERLEVLEKYEKEPVQKKKQGRPRKVVATHSQQ